MTVRVLILETQALFAEALRTGLLHARMDVVAVVPSGRDAIAFLEGDQADVILVSLDDVADSAVDLMKRRPSFPDGLAIGRRILKRWPDPKMILLSSWDDLQTIEGALRGGFRGYLSRATPLAEFVTSIQAIVDGRTVFPEGLPPFPGDDPENYPDLSHIAEPASRLTAQEQEIFEFLAEGSDTTTLARRLGISSRAVQDQVRAILRKLDPGQGSAG